VAAGFRVIVPDMIGSGYSDKPVEWEYTVPAHAESMLKLLDALGIAKAHVVGNSYGGGAALAMALAHPEKIDRLILLDPACYPQEFPKHVKLMRTPVIGDFLMTFVPTRWAARALLEEIYCDASRLSEEELVEYVHEHRFIGAERTLRSMALKLDDPATQEMHRHIPEIVQPTLVVWGENDKVLLPAHAARLHQEIKGSRVRMVPHCGHVPHMEYPSAINRLMLGFLKE
jgi:4,5:9,10-diseco-3-hydroxy-5,9,17-trioxoandrosta-1(10),2-diene-4-oate hydrolase